MEPAQRGPRTATIFGVLGRTYEGQDCSIARTLEVVGERWTLLVLRECFLGTARFDDFQRRLGIARNVLQARLARLVDEGVLERRPYQDRPRRCEYVLTSEGRDLLPVLLTLLEWGDRHRAPDGPPAAVAHRGCGGPVAAVLRCECCGSGVDDRTLEVVGAPELRPLAPSA